MSKLNRAEIGFHIPHSTFRNPAFRVPHCFPPNAISGYIRFAGNRQLIRPSEQGDRRFHLIVSFDVKAYPAAIWQNVVRFGHTGGYQLISNALGKRDIDEMIPMNMANLFTSQTILGATKAMSSSGHAGPTHRGLVNLFTWFHVAVGYRLQVHSFRSSKRSVAIGEACSPTLPRIPYSLTCA
jgi:hypothetical protein